MKRVIADCKENDWDDIRIGGPHFLGYDFTVSDDEDDEEIKNFVMDQLKKYKRGCISVKVYNVPEPKIWSREEIEKCIKENELW